MSKKLFFVVTFLFTAFLIFSCTEVSKQSQINKSDQKPNLLEMYTPPKVVSENAHNAKVHLDFSVGEDGAVTVNHNRELKYATDGTTTLSFGDTEYMNATQNFISNTTTVNAMGLVNIGFVNLYYRSNDLGTAAADLSLRVRVDGFDIGTFGNDLQTVEIYMRDPNGGTAPVDNVADGDDWTLTSAGEFTSQFKVLSDQSTACGASAGNDLMYVICNTAAACDGVGATDVSFQNLEFMINADLPANAGYTGDIIFEVCNHTANTAFTSETNPDKTIADPDSNP